MNTFENLNTYDYYECLKCGYKIVAAEYESLRYPPCPRCHDIVEHSSTSHYESKSKVTKIIDDIIKFL